MMFGGEEMEVEREDGIKLNYIILKIVRFSLLFLICFHSFLRPYFLRLFYFILTKPLLIFILIFTYICSCYFSPFFHTALTRINNQNLD